MKYLIIFFFLTSAAQATWQANSILVENQVLTNTELGAAQGIAKIGNYFYIYGDRHSDKPHVGIVIEFDLKMKPTGRKIFLKENNVPIITHPTGLTFHPTFGTFLGDTVGGKGIIYQVDFPKALSKGSLDGAIITRISDDAAVNGTRPEFVTWNGKPYIASADYGDVKSSLRIYDPSKLIKFKSSQKALVKTVSFVPFNQTLHWDAQRNVLTTNRNVVAGLGWQLQGFDLSKLLNGTALHKSEKFNFILPPKNELEGAIPFSEKYIFITSDIKNNISIAKISRAL